MVEIPTTDHIISSFIFLLHIFTEHPDLAFPNGITVSVSRHMQFKDHQLFSVIYRHSGNTVTSVQVKKFRKRRRNWKTSSHRSRNRIFRKQGKSGFAFSMRLCKRIKQKRGIIILCKYAVISRDVFLQYRILIHMITSGSIQIDLLDQRKIRIFGRNQLTGTFNRFLYAVLTLSPGRFSTIHEETEIRRISSESNIICKCGVIFLCCQLISCFCVLGDFFHLKLLIIRNPVITCIKINNIRRQHNNKCQQNNSCDLYDFFCFCFHRSPVFLSLCTVIFIKSI